MASLPLPIAQVALSGLNHVLQQQPSLRETMRAHAGRDLRIIVVGPLQSSIQSDARIGTDGLLAVVTQASPAVTLTLTPGIDAVFGALRDGPLGLGNHLQVEGDVMLAAAIGQVARSFRWDVEEDLSRLVGDSAAHRAGQLWRSMRERVDGAAERSREAIQRASTAANGPLVGADELAEFARDLTEVSERIGRIERFEQVERTAARRFQS